MKIKLFTLCTLCMGTMAFSQNALLTDPVTSALPDGATLDDIEFASNGTDVVLVAANSEANEFYAIDIMDNDPGNAMANKVTEIAGFQDLIDDATGQDGLNLVTFEVNPISKAVYVLARTGDMSQSFLIKIENDGELVTVLDQSNMTYSLINWDGGDTYSSQDMSWGSNTLIITSGSWTLDGEVATVEAPFVHESSTSNRLTSMYKTNWGGGYHTSAPLERVEYANINDEDRLLGVTVCAPGFSLPMADIPGGGVLEVREEFNVTFNPPVKVVHQNQDGVDYLFDLHQEWTGNMLIRIGEGFIDGSPIEDGEFNDDAQALRDFDGNPSAGLGDEDIKIYDGTIQEIAYWNDCNLLILKDDMLSLMETGSSESCLLSVDKINAPIAVEVYPNPTSNFIDLNLGNSFDGNQEVNLYNMNGQVVLTEKITASTLKLDLSHLSNGTYVVTVQDGNGVLFSETIEKQ